VPVSTLLEILVPDAVRPAETASAEMVSTLLEILGVPQDVAVPRSGQAVSTLLEILGLVCLVVVGF